MEGLLSQEKLREAFDRVMKRVMQQTAGIRLDQGEARPGRELCTVHIAFERCQLSSLTLCGETALFTRLTRRVIGQEDVTQEDVEDVSREYLNILCGHLAAELFACTRTPVRFGIPGFHSGRYRPEGLEVQLELNYASDECEHIQLAHYAPGKPGQIT